MIAWVITLDKSVVSRIAIAGCTFLLRTAQMDDASVYMHGHVMALSSDQRFLLAIRIVILLA